MMKTFKISSNHTRTTPINIYTLIRRYIDKYIHGDT